LPHTVPSASRKHLRGQCFTPIPDPQPLPSSLLKKKWGNDRTIMLSLINRWPLYPQTSLKKLPRTALPLTEIPASKTAPPLPETTTHVLTSLTPPFYKSHASPRVWAAPSFPGQPGNLGLKLNFALGCETFLVSFLCERRFF
jgi:hypothetical protein